MAEEHQTICRQFAEAMGKTSVAGWTNPNMISRKWHYFDGEKRSLCRRFGLTCALETAQLEDEYDNHSDNCAECKKRLNKKYPDRVDRSAGEE